MSFEEDDIIKFIKISRIKFEDISEKTDFICLTFKNFTQKSIDSRIRGNQFMSLRENYFGTTINNRNKINKYQINELRWNNKNKMTDFYYY